MAQTKSRTVKGATLFEMCLKAAVQIGVRLSLFTAALLLLYIGVGTIATSLGWISLRYPFLSLEADPIFVIGAAVTGLFSVQQRIVTVVLLPRGGR